MQQLFTELRGARFRPEESQTELLSAPVGTKLSFSREPENPHDLNAIKVCIKTMNGEEHVGYVPAEIAAWMADEIDEAGQVLKGRISAVNGMKPTIELFLGTQAEYDADEEESKDWLTERQADAPLGEVKDVFGDAEVTTTPEADQSSEDEDESDEDEFPEDDGPQAA